MLKGFSKFTNVVWPDFRGKKKKQEFLDKLKGITEIQIKEGTPVGVTFSVYVESTGHSDNYFQIGPNEWVSWGTSPKPNDAVTQSFTKRQLEIHLTELAQISPNGKINMIDESCCIKFGK